ncbi:MAG: hypothetical protein OWQ57_04410 [Sulfobacillus sp.]|nr:hypothetical protein [Sulfobacillus sp.]
MMMSIIGVMLWIVAGWWLQLLVHEMSHALARWSLGCPPDRIILGQGRCSWPIGRVIVHEWPCSGANWPRIYCLPISRTAKIWGLLAGAIGNTVVALGLAELVRSGVVPLHGVVWLARTELVGWLNLVPWRSRDGQSASDGLYLVALIYRMAFEPPSPCSHDGRNDGRSDAPVEECFGKEFGKERES